MKYILQIYDEIIFGLHRHNDNNTTGKDNGNDDNIYTEGNNYRATKSNNNNANAHTKDNSSEQ